jgi:transglutaminase-like putative cysteine protease
MISQPPARITVPRHNFDFIKIMKHLKISLSPALLAVMALAFASPGKADETARYSGSDWATLDPKQVQAAAAEVTQAQLPDCDEAIVDQKSMRVVHEDGTAEMQDETFSKVLTERGKQANNTLTRVFYDAYYTVEVTRLEIIKPDGTVSPVDVKANEKESLFADLMKMNIYDPDFKILKVNIPQLEIGDMVHSVVRTTVTRPMIPGEFAEDFMFEGRGYLRHLALEVRLPAAKPLKHVALREEIPGTVTASTKTEGNNLIYHWEVNRVPRMFIEPAMPPPQEVLQHLSISTIPDWSTVSRWHWNLVKPHLDAITPDMKKQVAELTSGATTDMEKIKAVFYYVSREIRYMGTDYHGIEPHDVNLTYDKKYGVCRDKAALLVALLRAAGQNAYPASISVGLKKDQEVPNPSFPHAIVAVELHPGEYILLDPTAENTRDLLPAYESNQSYLVCRPEGETLRQSPIDPPEKSMMRITTTGTIDGTGNLEAHSEMSFDGANDSIYRHIFVQMKPNIRQRLFEASLKHILPGAVLKSLKITPDNILDESVPLHAEIEFSAENAMAFGDGKAIITVPWIGKNIGLVNLIFHRAGLEERQYPMKTIAACGLHEEISLRLAADFTGAVSMPTCAPQDGDCVVYHREFSFKDGVLACSRDVRLKTVEISPDQYLQLRQTLKELQEDDRKSPVLAVVKPSEAQVAAKADTSTLAPVESDTRMIEQREELQAKDAHTALFKMHFVKEILNYSGKKKASEVKIAYNPATADARLVRAVVTSKDGQRQEISPEEINVMDADWNAGAKRYTGSRILVANLPGVEIGSTIEVDYEIAFHDKAFLGGFIAFQEGDEIVQKVCQITAPAGLAVHTLDCGPAGIVTANRKTGHDGQVLTWTATNVKARPDEPSLPPTWFYRAGVEDFIGDPAACLTEIQKALLDRSNHSAKAQELAHNLTATAKTKLDAVKAIRDFVSSSIRLAGPSFTELPLSELSNADTTLADGYGHVADRAILLYAMLSAAGFEPEFVLGSTVPAIDPLRKVETKFPFLHEFETVLVKVPVGNESYYCNDTDQYAQLGTTSHDGDLGISLAKQSLVTIQAVPGAGNRSATNYRLALDDTGKARMEIRTEYAGTKYGEMKKQFAELPPGERKRFFQELVSHVAQGARPVGDLTTNFDDYPGVVQFTVEIDHYAVIDGKQMYFDLPYTLHLFPAVMDHRTLPLLIGTAFSNTMHTEIELPAGFQRVVIAPKNQDLVAPDGAGQARISTTLAGREWSVTQELSTKPALVAPGDYAALLSVESALEDKSSRLLLLEH